MFIPDDFKEVRSAEIAKIMQDFPLASIVAHTQQGLIATHVPLLMKSTDVLVGHIAVENHMSQLVTENQEVLCIFQGSNAYISANYYPSKFEDHKKVPTWNYQVVHVYGTINFFTDKKSKLAALGMLTKQSERTANGAAGWKMSDAPVDYINALLDDLIVFEIQISKILAQSKLSQNRDERDFKAVVHELRSRGETTMAESMLRLAED